MSPKGYFDSPWPCEDGGPARLQMPQNGLGLGLQTGELLHYVARQTCLSTMTVLGAPGEVYLLTHSAFRAHVGLPTTACVERIDPLSLRTLQRSPRLAGGPMWPGGMAVHSNGDVYVVYGRFAHRLDRHCQPLGQLELPVDEPYNSFVVLDNGLIVTKNLSPNTPAMLSVIDPDSLRFSAAHTVCPEPSVARLSAIGNTVYVVGVRSIFRYHWDEQSHSLRGDDTWSVNYIGDTKQSYGWDAVLDGEHAWFMDNGHHRYRIRMIGAGIQPWPNRLIRVSLMDATDHLKINVTSMSGGSITNPPLVDLKRRIVIGYDSANRVLQAWRFDALAHHLLPIWSKKNWACASHMLLYEDTGELVINDYQRWGEEVTVLAIETGFELARVRTGGIMQGVVFPSVGWGRDFYWSSMGRVARVWVA
jgi:hypothetical protein